MLQVGIDKERECKLNTCKRTNRPSMAGRHSQPVCDLCAFRWLETQINRKTHWMTSTRKKSMR